MKRVYYTIDEGDGTEYASILTARDVARALLAQKGADFTRVCIYQNVDDEDGVCEDVSYVGCVMGHGGAQ